MSIYCATAPETVRPSALLAHLAGEAALALAQLWPAPHESYLTAHCARRHLLGVAIACGARLESRDAVTALTAPLSRAIARLVPDAPAGLRRALGRMGEIGWPFETYRSLVALLRRPRSSKVLRHLESVEASVVESLALLPANLLDAGLGRLLLPADAARVAADCFAAIAGRDGPERSESAARRWASVREARTLFEKIEGDLLQQPTLPFPSTPRLRWLTPADMIAAGRRFGNCLASLREAAARGESVLGEWAGAPPAIVRIDRDPVFGWRLEELLGPNNEPLAAAELSEIESELRALGVHVGKSGRDLLFAAQWAADENARVCAALEHISLEAIRLADAR